MAVEIALVAAMDEHRIIGRDNKLLWRLPEDMKFFRKVTKGNPVVVGRKTYESIGKPLPGRRNIVLSRDASYSAEGVETADSVETALEMTADASRVCVIGGGVVYAAFLPYANAMYLTRIEHAWDGDTRFPEWDDAQWSVVWEERGPMNPANPYDYRFLEYRRT